jgi:hypothetical protein
MCPGEFQATAVEGDRQTAQRMPAIRLKDCRFMNRSLNGRDRTRNNVVFVEHSTLSAGGGALSGAIDDCATVDDTLSLYLALSPVERIEFLTKALGSGSVDPSRPHPLQLKSSPFGMQLSKKISVLPPELPHCTSSNV